MISLILSFIFHIYHLILGVSTPNKFPPPLSLEEEKKHFALAKEGNEDSRQKLILHNLRLVSHIVRKYYSNAPDSEDLVSIGVIGLVKAVDTYKCETGIRFATYAARCIQNAILSKRTLWIATYQKKYHRTLSGAFSRKSVRICIS